MCTELAEFGARKIQLAVGEAREELFAVKAHELRHPVVDRVEMPAVACGVDFQERIPAACRFDPSVT